MLVNTVPTDKCRPRPVALRYITFCGFVFTTPICHMCMPIAASFIAIVASSRHSRETTARSSLFHSNAGTLLQSAIRCTPLWRTTYALRSTMGQPRLNHVMVAVVHRGKIEQLNVDNIITEFASRNYERRKNICYSSPMRQKCVIKYWH